MKDWLHIGLGNFHRAHQAYYFNELLKLGKDDWEIVAGNIREDAEHTVKALQSQCGEYMLETVNPQGKRAFHKIKSIKRLIPYTSDLKELIGIGADNQTKVISFTVTEAGYYLNQNLEILVDNPYIQEDLKGGNKTIYGTISKILDKRCHENAQNITLLCCDNIRENGKHFKVGLEQFLKLSCREDLITYLHTHTTCPNTMVDRITPRPSVNLGHEILKETGFVDVAPVMSEEFIQWVIEDNFANGRPDLETVGVQMVSSVLPYEDAKLRILNASHSCLAWAGVLSNYEYVFECAKDKKIFKLAYDYVTNAVIVALGNNGIDLNSYRDVVLERFSNDHIRDTLQRITQDSFSKIATFILPTIRDLIVSKKDASAVLMLIALSFLFYEKLLANKVAFEYQDADYDAEWMKSVMSSTDPIASYAQNKHLFGDLANNETLISGLKEAVNKARSLF